MSPRKPKQEIQKQSYLLPRSAEDIEDAGPGSAGEYVEEKAKEMLKEKVTQVTADELRQVEGVTAVYEIFNPIDEMAKRSALATAMAIQASRLYEEGKYTFYVLECLGCHDVNYIRAGKRGIKGASTWSKNQCPTCSKEWDLGTVNVVYQVGGEEWAG